MRIRTVPWAILRTHYRFVRVQVRIFEEQVIDRMPPGAALRLLYDRMLGAVEATTGMVLGDRTLESEGVARIERAAELDEAVQLDEIAARRFKQADEELRRRRATAPAVRPDESSDDQKTSRTGER